MHFYSALTFCGTWGISFIFDLIHWPLETTVFTDFKNSWTAGVHVLTGPFLFLLLDEDECATGNPCSQICHNAVGTYHCSCSKGLTIAADGRTCQGTYSSR